MKNLQEQIKFIMTASKSHLAIN